MPEPWAVPLQMSARDRPELHTCLPPVAQRPPAPQRSTPVPLEPVCDLRAARQEAGALIGLFLRSTSRVGVM